jgi:protease II
MEALLSDEEEVMVVKIGTEYMHRRVWARPKHSGGGRESSIPVPMSLVYHKDILSGEDGLPSGASVLMQVYGAYGLTDKLSYQPGR